MKWVDLSIEFVAVGSFGFKMLIFFEWEVIVLDYIYDFVDYVLLYVYYGNFEKDIKNFVVKLFEMEEFIKIVILIIDYVKVKKRSKKVVNILFDEWNVWYYVYFEGKD